jgi:hypothetical protein
VESLIHNRQLNLMIGIEALKKALIRRQTSLGKITDMAAKLGVFHRVRRIVEVLA